MNNLKIGITMRITEAEGYSELRDSLAHDWYGFFDTVFPSVPVYLLPNIGEAITDYVKNLQINALILSGGDDVGRYKIRDTTEYTLLDWAKSSDTNVLAVCRGLQIIHSWRGGKLSKMDDINIKHHRATRHKILIDNVAYDVNSYHTYKLDNVPESDIFAICPDDNTVEAIRTKNILGLMWHPEREKQLSEWQHKLIYNFFTERS